VSANGVEGYRQRTPKNIVEIAKYLLREGAEVDARASVYSGPCTTLSLAATSVHPLRARVQNALLEVLLEYGATLDGGSGGYPLVTQCLANGCAEAADFLAGRGAPLDLEGAAGLGRIEVVRSFFDRNGYLKPGTDNKQMQRAFLCACQFGRNDVVNFLLEKGADLSDQCGTGETGLHWAVVGAQSTTIDLLLKRGASLEERNSYGGTSLDQALWSFINGDPRIDYGPIFEKLLAAGAKVEAGSVEWVQKQTGRSARERGLIAEVFRRYEPSS
jgi:ankyrin repeat protein